MIIFLLILLNNLELVFIALLHKSKCRPRLPLLIEIIDDDVVIYVCIIVISEDWTTKFGWRLQLSDLASVVEVEILSDRDLPDSKCEDALTARRAAGADSTAREAAGAASTCRGVAWLTFFPELGVTGSLTVVSEDQELVLVLVRVSPDVLTVFTRPAVGHSTGMMETQTRSFSFNPQTDQ